MVGGGGGLYREEVILSELKSFHPSLGDNMMMSNIAIPFFSRLQFQEPFQVIGISANRD